MLILNGKQLKRIFIGFFLICFFALCSCHKQVEEPQETYSITYVTNGHGEQPENLVEQTNIPDPLPLLTEEGWTFEGWFTTSIFEPESEAVVGAELVEDTTLYAKWTEVVGPTPPTPEQKYSVTFVTNGHGKQPKNLAEQVYIPNSLPVLIEEGWIFGGWYLDDGTFLDEVKTNSKLTKDITLYAKWTEVIPFYVVDYKINNKDAGTLIGETHQIVYRGEDTTPVTVIPNIGYKFLGWNFSGFVADPTERVDELTRIDTNVQGHISATAVFQGPITCEMEFRAKEGGKVEGTLRQSVLYGDKGETVTAIPDEGFRFIRWSDGETEAVRTNDCVTYRGYLLQIYAEFERYKRDFKLEYNEATSNTELTDYTFYLEDMEKEQYLPVPQREGYEFVGWYSDWFHEIQVTDELGKMIVDRAWFNNDMLFYYRTNPDMKLYAKWKPIKEVPTYKILMIFVSEVHATLESSYKGMMQVDYVMNDVERILCEQIPIRMESYLEAILNGTVDFQIDAYFTKQPVVTEDFIQSTSTYDGVTSIYSYLLNRDFKPLSEVKDMQENYDSVITSFSLNDPESYLYVGAGVAGKKYANLHLEDVIGTGNLEYRLDLSYPLTYSGFVHQMEFYIHEFTHTVELQLQTEDFYGIHAVCDYYVDNIGGANTEFDFLKDYLRNEFNIGDRNVGIPYEFWTGEYEKI